MGVLCAELVTKNQFCISRNKEKCLFKENVTANCRLQLYYTQMHACTYTCRGIYSVYVCIYVKIQTHEHISFSSVPESSFTGIPILGILFVNRGPGDWSISLTSMDDEASSCELRLGPLSIPLLPNSLLKNDIICDISNMLL